MVINEEDNYWQRHRGHRIELHKDLTNKMMPKVPANLQGCRKRKAPDKQEFWGNQSLQGKKKSVEIV